MHTEYKLFITKKSFVLSANTSSNLIINRENSQLETSDTLPAVKEHINTIKIFGIMGFIRLLAGDYMMVITKRERIGSIRGKTIYKVAAFQILPLPLSLEGLNENQKKEEQEFVNLLETHLTSNNFYFSYEYDITQSLQRQLQFTKEQLHEPMYKRADERFFWNRFASSKFIDAKVNMSDYILPVMQGFIEMKDCNINGNSFAWGLITRRSRHRPGTRYFSRGIDAEGHVSNFVETEQLVLFDGLKNSKPCEGKIELSFVQTRGSIPVYWAQVINLKYTPRLWLGESRKSLAAARAHFDEQIKIYGPQILVNLVNTKGYELPMAQAYARVVEQLNDPRLYYTHFDFHSECSKMRWHRIQLLVDQLKDRIDESGYTYYDHSDATKKMQSSVIRSNCMDCLDRTNVVQSNIARYILNRQLHELGILKKDQTVEQQEDLMDHYRNVWADNADGVSCVYSGTGALKTDFTRTGRRTKSGALQDLKHSIQRYYKNNFMDGYRQDAFDLFLGLYRVDKGQSLAIHNPFIQDTPLRVRVVPYILVFALFMLILNLVQPGYSGFESRITYLLLILFWVSVLISAVRFALDNGDKFVQWPHLVSLPDTTHTSGMTEKGKMTPPDF
ncbi:SacI homology domain-containing protein [Pilobolus umbonatus]|nr:SacI homology domain-containing protein [Pilobolus umbonatus]